MSYGDRGFERRHTPRVLLFSVDDALFAFHLDWVEAVFPRTVAELHTVKTSDRCVQQFVLCDDRPAFRIELREVFHLRELGDAGERSAFLILRSGSYLLAVQVDACLGVRELDLQARAPIPTRIVRDGGVPVGHVIELDGSVVVVLDPSRFLDGATRDALAPALREAVAYGERERTIKSLWAEILEAPSVAFVRQYARLCRRNGHTGSAKAARLIVRYLETAGENEGGNGAGGDNGRVPLIAEVVRVASRQRTGELIIEGQDGAAGGKLVFLDGRVINAHWGDEEGRAALMEVLKMREVQHYLNEMPIGRSQERMSGSTISLAIEALASPNGERRRRS